MAKPNRRERDMSALCAEIGPEDGIDPRVYFRPESRRPHEHKTRRLCGEVARTLALTFPSPQDDEVLRACAIVAVEPAPDASRLCVTLAPARPGDRIDPAAVLPRLERIRGRLRTEVAQALDRKYAPTLTFRVLSGVEEGSHGD